MESLVRYLGQAKKHCTTYFSRIYAGKFIEKRVLDCLFWKIWVNWG